VPDGVLWYLPFEALQVGDQNESRDLLSLLSIRYAPTAALAVPDDRPVAPLARTLIASKPPFRGGDEKVVAGAVQQLVKSLPDAVHLESSLPAPSSVSNMMYDRLVVLGELDVQGLPFVGRSGQLLDKMLAAIGLDRSAVYIANVIPWRPPGNRTPTPLETEICRPFIERQIALADPDFLILLGRCSAGQPYK
jgi:hypothetical protein